MWTDIRNVGKIQIEITNYCNARCPLCYRAEMSKKDLNNTNISLKSLKKWLSKPKWNKLEKVTLCGNIDEPAMNPELIPICKFLLSLNPTLIINVETNGGCRSKNFWKELGTLSKETNRVIVQFAIDGLEDTNGFYRMGVEWKKLQSNFRSYIKNGGIARWQFIVFEHNYHQLEQAKNVSIAEGFQYFKKKTSYNKSTDNIKPYKKYNIDSSKSNETDKVVCTAKPNSGRKIFHPTLANLYINYQGYCLPCCWMGTSKEIDELAKLVNTDLCDINLNNVSIHAALESNTFSKLNANLQNHKLCIKKCKKLNQTTFNIQENG